MSDITNERIYREEQALRDGDVICCKDAEYTIVGEPIGFGGSSVLYGAKKSGSEILLAIKECFPAEGCCAFKRINGVIQPKDPDGGNAVAILAHFRDSIENEKRIGQHIFNTTNRAVPTIAILEPISVTTGGKTYTQVSTGIFSVQPRFDLKARSLENILNEIRTSSSNEERRKTMGLPNIYFTACLMEEVLKALQQIHKARDPKNPKMQGWIFGDLSPKNIFFAETDIAKQQVGIAHFLDYGSSMKLDEEGKTKELAEKDIFSTDGYRPPEAKVGGCFKLDQHADIYSAGCLLYRCVASNAKFAMAAKKRSPVLGPAALDDIDGKHIGCTGRALTLLNEILDKATKEKPSERYPNVDDMLAAILELKRVAEPVSYELPTNLSSPDYFIPHSRDKELSALAKSVNDGETVFLHGVGGIGKTECAIQLANLLNPPRGAYLVPFQNSMKETILRMKFSGYQFKAKNKTLEEEKQEEAEYQERLEILRKYYRDTVLIIDNFDADNKTLDELRREPAFVDFLGLDLKRIFTTRYPVGRKDWEIKELSDPALLKLMRHYCNDNNISDEQYLAILKEIQNHTLTATLIAKTLEESWGDITPEMILEALRGSKLAQEEYPEVVSDQNRSYQQKQIYEHLKALFVVNHLDEDAQRVLSYASLFPISGILASFLTQLIHKNDKEKVKRLVKLGWIISFDCDVSWVDEWWHRELNFPLDKRMLRIHPLIREVVCNEISEYEQYSLIFLGKLKDYYYTVRDGEYRRAEEFSDDGEVTNPNFQFIAECLILASNMLLKHKSLLLHDAGEILWDLHDSRAIACFQEAVALAEKNSTSKHFLAECYTSLGDAYSNYFLGDQNYCKALEYTTKAVELMEASMGTGEFNLSEVAMAYQKLAYRYHFAGDDESFACWMEKCVRTSLQCWDPSHPRITSAYKCLAEAYRHLVVHYKERILRKEHLEHKLANGGLPFEHQQEEHQSMLSETEYTNRIAHAEKRLAECSLFIAGTNKNNT